MVHPLWYFAGAFAACVAYEKLLTQEQKRAWENWIRAHHGEFGVVGAGLGIATKSPRLTMASLGLIAHDWPDRPHWFK